MTGATKPPKARPRSASRVAAVQALYQMDMAGTDLNAVVEEFVQIRFSGDDADEALSGADPIFFAEVLRGVVRRQLDIDPMIDQQLAVGWRLIRVDSILRAILRAGTFELLERPDVPARVAISEYVEVANAFFNEDEPKVVNGVLDKLARKLRQPEFTGPSPKK
jgi:transcription antitermination protein NusB